jgi:hypothetical protein
MEPLSHSNSVVRLAWLVFGVFLSLTASAEPVHLLAESDTPTGSSELFLLSFPSLTDMINSDNLSQQTVQFSLANTFSLGGFDIATANQGQVPEPGAVALVLIGLAGLALSRQSQIRA